MYRDEPRPSFVDHRQYYFLFLQFSSTRLVLNARSYTNLQLLLPPYMYYGSSLFDMGRRKEQMFFMFVQSFTNGQIMGFGC